jgi:hypothetical protein
MRVAAHPREWPRPTRHPRLRAALAGAILLSVLLPTSCGSGAHADDRQADLASASRPSSPVSAPCASDVALAYGQVAEHIYAEFAGGRVVEPAVRRLQGSPALLAAVQSANPSATRAALLPLIHGQLARVLVLAGNRPLAQFGHGEALAPVTAPLRNAAGITVGTLVASEQTVRGYVDTVASFASAHILVRSGSHQLGGTTTHAPPTLPASGPISFAGRRYSVYSFPAARFPSGSLRVYVLPAKTPASACGRTSAETVANTIGAAAVKIYENERSGARPHAVVRDFERSPAFQQAVASGNAPATEAAIVSFFKSRLHVVRVRASLHGRLVADVGGPHVLAPIGGSIRDARYRVVGHFLLSVQDDLGYLILSHRFTGAQVLLRQGSQQLMGNLTPGPPNIPDRGQVLYRGTRYQAFSFTAQAFPSGPLRVSLLIPPRS